MKRHPIVWWGLFASLWLIGESVRLIDARLPAGDVLPPPQIVSVQPYTPIAGAPVKVILAHPWASAQLVQLQWRWAGSEQWQLLTSCEWHLLQAPPEKLRVQFRATDAHGRSSPVVELVRPTISPRPLVRVVGIEPPEGPVYGHPFAVQLVAQSPLLRTIHTVQWRYPGETAWKTLPALAGKPKWVWKLAKVTSLKVSVEFRAVDERGDVSSSLLASWDVSPLVASFPVAQLGGMRERPSLHALALVPKTTRLVFAGDAGLVGWLDWQTGEVKLWPGHSAEHPVWDIAAITLPDGRMLALSGSQDGTARLWDVQKQKDERILTGHPGSVNAVAFSPDGKFCFTGHSSGRCTMWETATGKQVRELEMNTGPICVLRAWLQNGDVILAAGDADKNVHVWNASQGDRIAVQVADDELVWALAHASGKNLLTGGKSPLARYWRALLEKGALRLHRELFPTQEHGTRPWYADSNFTAAEFTPDEKFAVTCDRSGRLILWELEGGRPLRVMYQPNQNLWEDRRGFSDLVLTADGEFALTADRDGYVRVWYIGERPVR
jgi:WD40 repeat protein